MRSHRISYYAHMLGRVRLARASPKVWNYCKFRLFGRRPVVRLSEYSPQIAGLLITRRCNLHCGYCSVGKESRREEGGWQEGEGDVEKVRRIMANPLFRKCLLVDLLGGEPLLVGALGDIVGELAERGHLTNISTNGLLLAERIGELKGAGVTRINVSVYDSNREVLTRDLRKINRLFPVHASMVLLRSQIESRPERVIETAQFIKREGCRSLRFWMYRPMGLSPRSEEIIIESNLAYGEFRRRIEEALPGFCLWPATVKVGRGRKRCPQLWQRITCDMSGNVFICCGVDEPLSGGNHVLFRSEPEDIYNHPVVVRMRERLLDPDGDPPEVCRTCNLLDEPGW